MISKSDIFEQWAATSGRSKAIFARKANIAWSDIERMLIHDGAEVSEGSGSRVRIALDGVRAVFHRPHPQKEADRGSVAAMRRFLLEAGIEPGGVR